LGFWGAKFPHNGEVFFFKILKSKKMQKNWKNIAKVSITKKLKRKTLISKGMGE
jgi:hypothetical protein